MGQCTYYVGDYQCELQDGHESLHSFTDGNQRYFMNDVTIYHQLPDYVLEELGWDSGLV